MSLDTVLKIGRLLRNSSRRLDFFSYVALCPKKDAKGNYPLCLDIPVNENYDIDFDNISIVPERERDKLYYLKYKTSDKDTSTKYIYGDIYYSVSGTMSSNGKSVSITYDSNYRLGTIGPDGKNKGNAFDKAEGEFKSICNQDDNVEELVNLRHSVERGRSVLEKMMKYMPAVIHFFEDSKNESFDDFINQEEQNLKKICCQLNQENKKGLENLKEDDLFKLNSGSLFFHFSYQGKQWYEFMDAFEIITKKMSNEFVLQTENGFVFQKTLWPTLCSGDKKNDIQFPGFSLSGRYKSRSFTSEEVEDLFYAVQFAKVQLKNKRSNIPSTNYKVVVLPRGENITVDDLIEFNNKGNEDILRNSNEFSDDLVSSILGVCSAITSFDFLFLRYGSGSKPDTVLIEMSNITRSNLSYTNQRIKQIAHDIYKERKDELHETNPSPFEIPCSFKNILGEVQFDEKKNKIEYVDSKKYQSHILWALASIYQSNYYNDESLLHSFIQNVEATIRLGKGMYRSLKYDLKFLLSIQNNQSNKYMEIIDSKSYQIGVKLGKISKPLKKAIKPFEKSYVGLLSRRIPTKDECISFVNDICQKLVMHERAWPASCAEVCTDLANLPVAEYDADKLAFGFFEGYFRYEPTDNKKVFQKRLENIVSAYEGNDTFEDTIEQLQTIIEELDKQD